MKFVYFIGFRSELIENRVVIRIAVIKSVGKNIIPDGFFGPFGNTEYFYIVTGRSYRYSFRLTPPSSSTKKYDIFSTFLPKSIILLK